MTQALNLANFANFLNTSGQVSASGLQAGITVPSGIIAMWSGSITAIPAGWVLCDGTGSTPDLRNMFVIGAGSTYSIGNTGGSKDAIVVSHTHTATSTVTDAGHTHTSNAGVHGNLGTEAGPFSSYAGYGSIAPSPATINSATTGISVSTTNATAGSSGTNANLPPYYALAFIMKT